MTLPKAERAVYRNIYIEDRGKRYRVAFHAGLHKPMLAAVRLGGRDAERCLKLDGVLAKRIIKKARERLP